MLGIGTIISLAASVFQIVQASNRPDAPANKTDRLFSQLDITGKGAIENTDLQSAFDKMAKKEAIKSDQLFSKLDANSDGKITKEEFSGSIDRLVEQLDQQYMRMRVHEQTGKAGFSQEDLAGLASNIANNFTRADADGNGKVSVKEAASFMKVNPEASVSAASGSPLDNENVDLMLQVMRLMQTYGTSQAASDGNGGKGPKISASA